MSTSLSNIIFAAVIRGFMLERKIQINTINRDKLYDLSTFVVEQNFIHHENNLFPTNFQELIASTYEEECVYFNDSTYFVAMNRRDQILGSVRTLRWNKIDPLPFEKIFNLSAWDFFNIAEDPTVWHIGRFAVCKDISTIGCFKSLVHCAISPICNVENSVVFAECDSKLLKTLSRMGIKSDVIAEPIYYLGSETIPVSFHVNSLKEFLVKNQNDHYPLLPIDGLSTVRYISK